MTAAVPAQIPKVGQVALIKVGGCQVELRRIPARMYNWTPPHPMEQALMEISLDGELVGLAIRPHGFGRQSFRIAALWTAHRDGFPEQVRFGAGYLDDAKRLYTADQVARKAVELRTMVLLGGRRQLMTRLEIAMAVQVHRDEEARRAVKADADRRRWAREEVERKRLAGEHRDEVLAGLRDIATRSDLSNLERAAVVAAVARYEADRI